MTPKEIIDLFDSKFRRLESSNLIRFITDRGCKFSFDFTTNNLGSDAVLPDLEFIESYVLNLRFFIQDNEPTSLRNMGKLYDTHYYGQEINERFAQLREVFNSELDRKWLFRFNEKEVTYRDIFMGFIYAELAHSKVERHSVFHDMTRHPFGYYLAFDSFLRCINFAHDILSIINQLNKTAFG
ncbi:MAG: hypothetical protein WA151_13185 [Desulfatirhabdiaceae bacterium]